MDYKFITPVSMKVTKEQYERDLEVPLEELGYCFVDEDDDWDTFSIIVNNLSNTLGHLSYVSEGKTRYNRYFIDHYNPELFLALAAMNNSEKAVVGEYRVVYDKLVKVESINYKGWFWGKDLPTPYYGNGYGDEDHKNHFSPKYFEKATKEEILNYFNNLNKKENMKQPTKRFPFKLQPNDAKRIVQSACESWKRKLITDKDWGHKIIHDASISISETFYKEMREACTKPQHTLFDEIFGKDEGRKFKVGDWISHPTYGFTRITEVTDGGYSYTKWSKSEGEYKSINWNGFHFGSAMELDSELWTIDKAEKGDLILCGMNNTDNFIRRANGKGNVYGDGNSNTTFCDWTHFKPYHPLEFEINE